MRKRLLSTGAVVGVGALLAVPFVVAAQDDDADWLSDTLTELVQDGTLTEDQATAVENALEDARPHGPLGRGHDHGPGHHRGAGLGGWVLRGALDDVADVIGIEVDALVESLRDDQTIAEIADANGVPPADVIDALVAEAGERLDQLVEDGRLDQGAADDRRAQATERITEIVNDGFRLHRHGPRGD